MGAGKTTVGQLLARKLGRRFLDSDQVLEARTGVSIATIFEIEGEASFRQREAQVIDELLGKTDLVLSTGGGAVLSEPTRIRLRERAFVIYLHASPETSFARVRRHREQRPLLKVDDPLARLREIYAKRHPLYLEVADLVVETALGAPQLAVQAIVKGLISRGKQT